MRFKIKIDQPYAPFTHQPGAHIPVPGTDLVAVIDPARLEIGEFVLDLPLTSHVTDFSAHLDLKKGIIFVYVTCGKEYWRYHIKAAGQGIHIVFDRGFTKRFLIPATVTRPLFLEEISTGIYKNQEWERLIKRGDLKEIIPLWFMASQWYKKDHPPEALGDFTMGFSALFYPKKREMTGYKGPDGVFPLTYLRSLFAQLEGDCLTLMPSLPKPLVCGRAKLRLGDNCLVEMLWSNGALKKAVITPFMDQEVILDFPGKSCRFLGKEARKGQLLSCKKGIKLFLDHFSK